MISEAELAVTHPLGLDEPLNQTDPTSTYAIGLSLFEVKGRVSKPVFVYDTV